MGIAHVVLASKLPTAAVESESESDAPSRLDFRGLPPDKRIRDDEVLAQVRAIVLNLQQSLSRGNC